MHSFAAEGVSNASLESAMANALMKAGAIAADAARIEFAITFAGKRADDTFCVMIMVHALDHDDLSPDDEEGDGESDSRTHDLRTPEALSDHLQGLIYGYTHQAIKPDLAEVAAAEVLVIERAVPDTTDYTAGAAAEAGGANRDEPKFDLVHEAPAALKPERDLSRIVIPTRDISDVALRLSPQHNQPPSMLDDVLDEAREEERLDRERRRRDAAPPHNAALHPHPALE